MAVAAALCAFAGCRSEDVNLGGTEIPDASSSLEFGFDAGPVANLCDPCESTLSCPGGAVCAALTDANMYCGTVCPLGNECGDDETCTVVLAASGGEVNACVPNSGSCGDAEPPVIDGEMPEHCGALEGPTVPADCNHCQDVTECQENGCYGGWWCDTRTNICLSPPSSCP